MQSTNHRLAQLDQREAVVAQTRARIRHPGLMSGIGPNRTKSWGSVTVCVSQGHQSMALGTSTGCYQTANKTETVRQ